MAIFRITFLLFLLASLTHAPFQLFAQEEDEHEMEEIRTYKGHTDEVEFVVFSKDGKYFASGGNRGNVFLWNTETGELIKRFKGNPSKVNHISFSNDGTKLAAAFGYGTVIVWNVATGLVIRDTPYLMNERSTSTALNFVVFGPDDEEIFFGGETAYLCKVHVDSNDYPQVIQDFTPATIEYGTAAPDKRFLAFSVGPDLMYLDMKSGTVSKKKSYPGKKLTSFSFSHDGSKMATWFMGGQIQISEVSSGAVVNNYTAGGGNPWSRSHIYFSPGDSLFISGTDRHSFDIWYVDSGEKKKENEEHFGPVRAMAFHPKGEWILSGSTDKTIKLWKFKGEEVEEEEEEEEEAKEEDTYMSTSSGWQAVPEEREKPKLEPKKYEQLKDIKPARERSGFETKPEKAEPESPLVYKLPYTLNGRVVQEYKPYDLLEFNNTTIEIRVWDDKILDGDIISLYLNDSLILGEFEITKEVKKIKIQVPKGSVCYLTLYAHNLGTIPPNTANISISDGITEKKLELKSDLYKSASVELKVKY